MILYHGSYLEIEKPDLKYSRDNVDFGRGFYTTPIYEQAVKWCGKFKRRGNAGVISKYCLDENKLQSLKVLQFDFYSEHSRNIYGKRNRKCIILQIACRKIPAG